MNTFIVINKCRRIFIKVLLALLFNNNLKVELKTHQSAALQPQFVLAKLWEFGLLNDYSLKEQRTRLVPNDI